MPAYSSIITYVRCDEKSFTSEMNRFRSVLAQIGFNEDYLENSFSGLSRDVCDNGFMYSGCNTKFIMIDLFGTMLNIRPSAMGWTPQISKDIKETWLDFDISFDMEDIIMDLYTFRIKDEVKIPIWNAMLFFSKHFGDTGVYLINEGTYGTWEAMSGNFWSFDAAIIPVEITKHYNDIPKDLIIKESDGSLYCINKAIWGKAPW